MRKEQTRNPGKRETAIPNMGQGLAEETKASNLCNGCGERLDQCNILWRCSCCKLMVYCGKDCQKAHWPEHKILCNAIKHEIEQKTPKTNYTSSGIFVSHLTPKQHAKVISLVGRRCAIKARLNEKVVQILWDTGAQVSMISTSFIREHFPNLLIRDVGDLLDGDLNLTAANGSDIPYRGWVELDLQIGDSEHVLSGPLLVTDEKVRVPLVGFNVIYRTFNQI